MNIFIVGASGLVGSHCLDLFSSNGHNVKGTYFNYPTANTIYFDPLEQDLSSYFFKINFHPDIILHCAALTNVDYCELNPKESYEKTVESTKKIAKYCVENKIRLIYISTDYVFDGTMGPYLEGADVNPLNIYGIHKLESERIVSTVDDYLIARITNVYGEETRSKNFISRLILNFQNSEEKNLALPSDQFATPIYSGDVARMLWLLVRDKKKGVYHLSSTDYYNRYQLAIKIKSYFEENTTVKLFSVNTLNSRQVALRPLYGGLLNIKFTGEYPTFEFTNVDSFILKNLKK